MSVNLDANNTADAAKPKKIIKNTIGLAPVVGGMAAGMALQPITSAVVSKLPIPGISRLANLLNVPVGMLVYAIGRKSTIAKGVGAGIALNAVNSMITPLLRKQPKLLSQKTASTPPVVNAAKPVSGAAESDSMFF